MITTETLKSALLSMGFSQTGNVFEKQFSSYSCAMEVDFDQCKLIYPDVINGFDRNVGFDAPENFVVFECVNRLLEKGYRPEDIELEKEWHLGHDAQTSAFLLTTKCSSLSNVKPPEKNLIRHIKIR